MLLEVFSRQLGGGAYESGAQALNFGAFIAFMGVNAASSPVTSCAREKKPPASAGTGDRILGVRIHLVESESAGEILGTIWLGAGIAYGAWKTKGFKQSVEFEAAE